MCAQPRLRSVWADLSSRWAHMQFCWFCHEAAHVAMMDSLRQQFYPRMRQAGRDRKISDSHRKGYSCPMCDDVVTDQDFHWRCPLPCSNNRNNIKKLTQKRERISVWDSKPGLSSAKRNNTASLCYPLD